MEKANDVITNFLFEISAFILPGFLMLHLIIIPISEPIIWDIIIVKSFDSWFSLNYNEYSFPDWILIIVFSYVVGMYISALVFQVMKFRHPFFGRFSIPMGMYRILKTGSKKNRLGDTKEVVISKIETIFELNGLEKDDKLRKNIGLISQLVKMYIVENSKLRNPSGRYYTRLCMAQNFSFIVFCMSIFQLFIFSDINFGYRVLIMILHLGIIFLLLQYVRTQALWLAEMKLRRFHIVCSGCKIRTD